MTSETNFYPQSPNQPSAGYPPTQVYSPHGSYSQPLLARERDTQSQVYPPQSSYHQPSTVYLPNQDYSSRGYSQPSAAVARYQQSQVYPSQSSFSQPLAGYQQQTQGYTSSSSHIPRAASVADTGTSAAGVPVAQPPIVEETSGYGYPQDSKTMYPTPGKSGVADSTAESAGSQYSTQPMDPYYDRGMYNYAAYS
jgi:hypothetical protein